MSDKPSGNHPEHRQEHPETHEGGLMDRPTARWYAENYGDHFTNYLTVQLAGIEPDQTILDIGCGSGTAVREASSLIIEGTAVGVDPSPAMLEIAQEKTADWPSRDRTDFRPGSAENLPLESNSVDIAMAINSIHHWTDFPEGLTEVRRILKTAGRLLITEELLEDGRLGHGEGPLADPKALVQILETNAFRQIEVTTHENEGEKMVIIVSRL